MAIAEAPISSLPVRFDMTYHARLRATEMEVPEHEVWEALTNPEVAYAQPSYGRDRYLFQRGRLAVPVAIAGRRGVVLSVLWRIVDDWAR